MKRLLLMVLAVIVVIISISGCTGNDSMLNNTQPAAQFGNKSVTSDKTNVQVTIKDTGASMQFVAENNSDKGYYIRYPAGWFSGIANDRYVQVENSDGSKNAIVWPVVMSGNYTKADALDMTNYLVGQMKGDYSGFVLEDVHLSGDKTFVLIDAAYNKKGVSEKMVISVVTKNNATFLSGYSAPVSSFASDEPVLREILSSYKMIEPSCAAGSNVYTSLELVDWTDPTVSKSMTAKIPKGWKVEIVPDCSTHAIRIYDPENPANQIFRYQELLYYGDSTSRSRDQTTKQNNKNNCVYNAPQFGISMQECYDYVDLTLSYVDNPVIDNTPRALITQGLPESYHLYNVQTYLPWSPHLDDVDVLYEGSASSEIEAAYSAYNFKTSALIAGFKEDYNYPAVGVFLVATGPIDAAGMWMGSVMAYSTEPSRFSELSPSLIESIASFQYTSEFTSSCQKAMDMRADAIAKNYQTIQETNDIISAKYKYQSETETKIFEQYSDATLGRERVYNADVGEVYQVPNGFYDYYNTHKEEYEMKNLQQLSQGQWGLVPLDGNLHIN